MAAKLAKLEGFHGSGPVRYRLEGPAQAPTGISISIDYSNAPVPDHYYVADYFEVANLDPQVLFILGKRDYPDKVHLRNKIEVYFPAIFFVKQLWQASRQFHENLRTSVGTAGYKAEVPESVNTSTEKVQTLQANNVLIVQSGTECMMDFYYLSPREFYVKAPKGQELDLQPLVRVILTHRLLLGFLDVCEPIASILAPRYIEEVKNEAVESC